MGRRPEWQAIQLPRRHTRDFFKRQEGIRIISFFATISDNVPCGSDLAAQAEELCSPCLFIAVRNFYALLTFAGPQRRRRCACEWQKQKAIAEAEENKAKCRHCRQLWSSKGG